MKEIIVIDIDDNICKSCDKCLHEPRIVAICNLKNNLDLNFRKEQVPETWEELKELCKDLKGVVITDNGNGICFRHLYFWKEGIIEDENQNLLSEATPERQWQIIKSLIGEE